MNGKIGLISLFNLLFVNQYTKRGINEYKTVIAKSNRINFNLLFSNIFIIVWNFELSIVDL